MKSSFSLPRRAPLQPSIGPVEVSLGYQRIAQTIQELEDLKQKHADEHAQQLAENKKEHRNAMAQLDVHFQRVVHQATLIQKGTPGINGRDGVTPDAEKITQTILGNIRQPKDGETPVINHDEIARKAAKLIKLPVVKDGKDARLEEVVPIFIKALEDGAIKLKPKHIDGLEQQITSYRAQLAGKHYGENTMARGGGDTVAAGTGVTISNANGVKTISASGGGGFTALQATETPNGVIKTFTFSTATAQPSYLRLDNVLVKAINKDLSVNWTWASGPKQATLASGFPPPNNDIEAIV